MREINGSKSSVYYPIYITENNILLNTLDILKDCEIMLTTHSVTITIWGKGFLVYNEELRELENIKFNIKHPHDCSQVFMCPHTILG